VSIIFSPGGMLNVSADASDLPQGSNGMDVVSDAMVRCKNLRLNQQGRAITRDGSAKVNATAIAAPIWWIEVQGGTRYAFAGSAIYEDETSIAVGLTPAQWTAIQYNAFNDPEENIFALNGTDRKRIEGGAVMDWGIAAPTVAPVLSFGSATGLTGVYNCKYTYVRKVGSTVVAESNPSPVGNSATLSNQKLHVTVTAPGDSQVTHIRLYRTSAGGATYNFDQDIAVGSTSFESSQADAALGDELETDHDRPPAGTVVLGPAYDGTCFILLDNLLYYCKPKQPEYWPALYYIEVGAVQFPLRTGVFHNGQLYCLSGIELFYIQGTGHNTFIPIPMRAKTGAQSARGAVSVAGKGIYHTGPDGIYLFSSGSDTKITESSLEPLFRGETVEGMPGVADMSTSWLFVFRNHLYFGYRSSGFGQPTNVIVLNLDSQRLTYYVYDDGDTVQIRSLAVDHANKRFLVGDEQGFIRVIESTAYTEDGSEPIAWEVQSKDFMLQTRKHFPRWLKYDVDASAAQSCTGALVLDGSIHHSHTITGSRETRRRLVDTGNGNRAAIRLSGTGPVSIFSAEGE
jgi:hypothetical protein